MKKSKRMMFFRWVIYDVFNGECHNALNFCQKILFVLLFPIKSLFVYDKSEVFRYDVVMDVFTIFGIKYSGQLFRSFGFGLGGGSCFSIERKYNDGTFSLRRIDDDRAIEEKKSFFAGFIKGVIYSRGETVSYSDVEEIWNTCVCENEMHKLIDKLYIKRIKKNR